MSVSSVYAASQPISLESSVNTGLQNTSVFYTSGRVYILGTSANGDTSLLTYSVLTPSLPRLVGPATNLGERYVYAAFSDNNIYVADTVGNSPKLSVYDIDTKTGIPELAANRSLPRVATAITSDNQGNVYIAFSNVITHYFIDKNDNITALKNVSTGKAITNSTASSQIPNAGLVVDGPYLLEYNSPTPNSSPIESLRVYNKQTLSLIKTFSFDQINIDTIGVSGTAVYIAVHYPYPLFQKYVISHGGQYLTPESRATSINGAKAGAFINSITGVGNKVAFGVNNDTVKGSLNSIYLFTGSNKPAVLGRVTFNGEVALASNNSTALYAISGAISGGTGNSTSFDTYKISN